MTKNRRQKNAARTHAATTGQTYQAARLDEQDAHLVAASQQDTKPALWLMAGNSKRLAFETAVYFASQRGPVVFVDPKGDGGYADMVLAAGGQVVPMGDHLTSAEGIFDPLRFSDSAAVHLATDSRGLPLPVANPLLHELVTSDEGRRALYLGRTGGLAPLQITQTRADEGPRRLQRRGFRGWRKPDGAVFVGSGTRWANPAKLSSGGCNGAGGYSVFTPEVGPGACLYSGTDRLEAHRVAAEYHRDWITGTDLETLRAELGGRDLVCWCPLTGPGGQSVPCHADELIRLANP